MKKGLFKVNVLSPNGEGKTFDIDYYCNKHMPMIADPHKSTSSNTKWRIFKMQLAVIALALCMIGALATPVSAQEAKKAPITLSNEEFREASAIISDLAADYRNDHMAIDANFGIKLEDRFWTIGVKRKETASARGRLTDHSFGPHTVTVTEGAPAKPTWYFEIADMKVLRLIASGEVNAGTAAMQSFASDEVGVETRDMEGFKSTSGDEADLYLILSHFFTKGKPEVTRFSRATSLGTHGAQATALHMMKGFRVSYFSIGPQEVANASPDLSSGQMPNLFIVISGNGTLHTDNGPMKIEAGMSVFVPQFVKHEIVNDGKVPLEGVLVLYGDNSDFAFGKSYPAFIQDLNQFYRTYPFPKPGPEAKFSLGISMNVGNEDVIIQQVVKGSAAEKDGLKAGDRIVSVGGTPIGNAPMDVLDPYLKNGTPMEFKVERKGKILTIRVTPLPKK